MLTSSFCSIVNFFGINLADLPAVRLINLHGMSKFKLQTSFSQDNIAEFITQYTEGALKVLDMMCATTCCTVTICSVARSEVRDLAE